MENLNKMFITIKPVQVPPKFITLKKNDALSLLSKTFSPELENELADLPNFLIKDENLVVTRTLSYGDDLDFDRVVSPLLEDSLCEQSIKNYTSHTKDIKKMSCQHKLKKNLGQNVSETYNKLPPYFKNNHSCKNQEGTSISKKMENMNTRENFKEESVPLKQLTSSFSRILSDEQITPNYFDFKDDWCISPGFFEKLLQMSPEININSQNESLNLSAEFFETPILNKSKVLPAKIRNPKPKGIKKTKQQTLTEMFPLIKSPKEDCEHNKSIARKRKNENHSEFLVRNNGKRYFCTQNMTQHTEIQGGYFFSEITDINVFDFERKIQKAVPAEIGFSIFFFEGFCQLQKQSAYKGSLTPKGLILAIKWDQDYIEYIFINFDFTGLKNFNTLKVIILHILSDDYHCKKICFNAQILFVTLLKKLALLPHELKSNWKMIDIMIGCYLLDPDTPCASFGGALNILNCPNASKLPSSDPILQGCYMLDCLFNSSCKMSKMLIDRDLWNVFYDIEMEMVFILAEMEFGGISVSTQKLHENSEILDKYLRNVESEAHKLIGKIFPLNSVVQVRKVIYDELKLDKKINIKVKETSISRAKSTSEEMLLQLVNIHRFPGLVLEFRHLQKGKSTFVDALMNFITKNKIHPSWEQINASTGRISCRNPNLQAIPKNKYYLKLFPENPDEIIPSINLRSVFESRPGYTLVSGDFQHIEFRVFAQISQDQDLIQIFKKSGDIFVALSNIIFGYNEKCSTKNRDLTKKLVYAIMYGAGVGKISEILGVNYKEATEVLNKISSKFTSFREFGLQTIEKAKKFGFLTSISGRRRIFPNINNAKNAGLRKHAERQAVNFVIQGSAADICKSVMISIDKKIKQKFQYQCFLLLQIHDELVWEVQDEMLNFVIEELQNSFGNIAEICEEFCKLEVSLPVCLFKGKNWGVMDPIL